MVRIQAAVMGGRFWSYLDKREGEAAQFTSNHSSDIIRRALDAAVYFFFFFPELARAFTLFLAISVSVARFQPRNCRIHV